MHTELVFQFHFFCCLLVGRYFILRTSTLVKDNLILPPRSFLSSERKRYMTRPFEHIILNIVIKVRTHDQL